MSQIRQNLEKEMRERQRANNIKKSLIFTDHIISNNKQYFLVDIILYFPYNAKKEVFMKKFVLGVYLLTTGLSLTASQRWIGGYLGDPIGINLVLPAGKYDLNVYAGFGGYWYWGNSLRADIGLRVVHSEFAAFNRAVFPNNPEYKLYYYAIPSVMVSFAPGYTDKLNLGGEVAFGLNFPFGNLDLFWDVTPGIRFLPPLDIYVGGGIGLRIPF